MLVLLLIIIGFTFGYIRENNKPNWEVSPLFEVEAYDGEGIKRMFSLRGIENKIAITDAPLIKGVSQKVMWYVWDDAENVIGKSLRVEGESSKTGKKKTLFESTPLLATASFGATTSTPSTIELNSTGIWKLDIYLDNTYYETIFVEGKESYIMEVLQ